MITPEKLLKKRLITMVDDNEADHYVHLYLDNGKKVRIEAVLPPGSNEPVIMVWDDTHAPCEEEVYDGNEL